MAFWILMLQYLKNIDARLFLYLNNKHNGFFDVIMYWASDKLFWVPFYLLIAILIVKFYRGKSLVIFISIALLITITDQVSSNLIRDSFQRLRPSHEPAFQHIVHLSKAGPGGQYGFVSSHAANAFALAGYLLFLLPASFKKLKYILIIWAVLVAYSRVYNGVHYPGDILGGAVLGFLTGFVLSRLTMWIFKKYYTDKRKI